MSRLARLLRPGGAAWRAAFWLAAGLAFVLAVLPQPPIVLTDTSDKVQHMLAFAVLALLARLAFPRASFGRLLIVLALFGGAIEMVQAIPALHRDSDWRDWLADVVAAGAVMLVALAVRRVGPAGAGVEA